MSKETKWQTLQLMMVFVVLFVAVSSYLSMNRAATDVAPGSLPVVDARDKVAEKIERETAKKIDERMKETKLEIIEIIHAKDAEIERIYELPDDSLQAEIDRYFHQKK
jgi:hypothetical protein